MVLVEWTMSVPGFLLHVKHAAGPSEPVPATGKVPTLGIRMLQAQALWVGALIVGVWLLVGVVGAAAQRG
jgi:hypothetical protein